MGGFNPRDDLCPSDTAVASTRNEWTRTIHLGIRTTKHFAPPLYLADSRKDEPFFSALAIVDVGVILRVEELFPSGDKVIPHASRSLAGSCFNALAFTVVQKCPVLARIQMI